jgi:hypothetical protein
MESSVQRRAVFRNIGSFFRRAIQLGIASGIPRFRFEGTIHGREMKVTMMNASDREREGSVRSGPELPMDGKKVQ